jgi:outer membrane protein
MRNGILGTFSSFCFLFLFLSFLPASAPAADTAKFGAIDIQKVLNESEAGKKAKSDLESLIKSKQANIDEKGRAIDKLKSDMEKQSSILSEDARKKKEDELERMVRVYQHLVQDSQAELKKKESELTDGILKQIRDMVDKIGEEEGYTIIFEKGTVLYSSKGIDITEDVLKRFDAAKAKSKK